MWAKLIDLKNTFEGKFLAVMLSVLLATSMVNFAAFAGDEVDQTGQGDGAATTEQTEPASETPEANEPPASQPAPEPPALQQPAPESPTATPPASEPSTGAVDEAVIALEMENAFIVVKGQQITGSTLNVPRQEELAFVATPDDGYEIDSVKAENAANADVPVATQDGTSKIAPEFVDSTLVITVKAKAVETDVPPTVETTPITNDIKIEPNGDVTEGESAATDGGSAVEEEDHSANFRSGRGIDIKDSITVEVGESKTYNGEDANYHRWAVQSGSDYVELSSTSSKAVVIKGKSAGTAVLKHSVKGWVGARQWTVKEYISVRVTEPAIQRVEFYYLQSPNANPDSNDTGQWGPMAGIGTADVSGANWQGGQDGKNIFDVSNRVKSWPSGLDGGTVAKTSEHWMTIFNQFKGEVEEDLGVTITPDDVESITLTPHKISRNNSTVPDKHVDCVPTIHVKNNILVQYTYHLWDAGDTRFQVTDRATVKGGSATSPQDNYTKGQTVKVAGRTYTFSGWYLNENLTGDPVKFPYTINENTDFWAKFIPSYFVDYDLDGGTWAETQSRFEYDSNDTVTVLSAVPAKPGYTFAGWAYSGGETTYNGGDSFTMPDQDVTLTAQWKSNEAKTSLWFYTTEGETGPYVWNGSALVGKDQADTNIWIGTFLPRIKQALPMT